MSTTDALSEASTTKALISLSQQSEEQLGGSVSVLVRQKRDHVKLDRLLHELAMTSPDEHDRVLRLIFRLVFPHAFAEEAVLWPTLRRVLPDGEELTLRVEREHQEINELLTRIEGMAAGSADQRPLLDRVTELLREDVRDEEDELLPRLQERVDVRRLRLLGFAWELARRTAPTRPHPVVSRRPPGNVLAALPLAAVDRLRDRVDRRMQQGGRAQQRLERTSKLLARISHAVERVPILRRGEDPLTSSSPAH